MWGHKPAASAHYVCGVSDSYQEPAADFDRGYRWSGERYEYLFLKDLPLGDTNQRDLSAAGQHGWKVIQVGVDVSALGHAVSAWAMLVRQLPPAGQDYQAHLRERPFMDEHGNPRLRER